MKGLILKDMINMKAQVVMYVVILAIWMAVAYFNESTAFFMGVMQMLVAMIPLMSIAYDERAKWELFALTMPVTRREIVASKYAFVVIVIFAVVLVSLLCTLVLGGEPEESLALAMFSFPLGLALNSVILPIMFRFGVEKGRFVFLGLVAAFLLAGFLVARMPGLDVLEVELAFTIDNVWIVGALFWLVCLALAAISLAISFRIYAGKEF